MAQGLEVHTPEGFSDVLLQECSLKRKIEQTIMQVFYGYGYQEVETPTVEYYEVFAGEKGALSEDSLYKFFDRSGRVLTLRPDITTPIARMAATKFREEQFPLKLRYLGKGYRYEDVYQGIVQREFTQSGVELLGEKSDLADAEIIAMTIEALLECSMTEFQIDLGQVAFFRGLTKEGCVDEECAEKLRKLIDKKDELSIEELVSDLKMDSYWKEILIDLPRYFGDVPMLERFDLERLPRESKEALINLKNIYKILCNYGYEKYISIDLSMIPGMDYYTGMIMKGFTRGVGFPICGGGRYDHLISKFGKNIPATGVAIGIDRVIAALSATNTGFAIKSSDGIVCADESKRKEAYELAKTLRKEGLVIEQYLGEMEMDSVKNYANSRGIGGIFYLKKDGKIQILDLINETQKEAEMKDLTGSIT